MEEENKDLQNKIEEANYQLRVEIAERCFNEDASINFVVNVCLFTTEEVISIYRSLKRRNYLLDKQERDKKSREIYEKNKELRFKNKKKLTKEEKQIELKKTRENKQEKQKQADFQREIAAENTRILLQKIKEEQKIELERQKREKEADIFRRKELEIRMKNKNEKFLKKEVLDAPNELSKEQKMIASVGKCYLRGLSIEQAVIFSKASPEQVERVYNAFKNK